MSRSKQIKLEQFKKLWKTKKALELLKNKELWQEILAYYRPKVHKPKGSITWKDLADRVFSEYVRLYYADDKWYVRCITSGLKMKWNDQNCQAWHFISRWVLKYRYDITNVYPQSYQDNCLLKGNYPKYTLVMIEKLGIEEVERRVNDKELVEIKQYQYEEMILNWYEFICEKKKKIWQNQKQGVEYTTKTE